VSQLAPYLFPIRALHVACALLSGALFTVRGVLRLLELPAANARAVRLASYLIDSTLLAAALLLMGLVRQYPLVDGWLTMKLLLLLAYIALGMQALRRARTPAARAAAFAAALLVYGAILGVAVTRQPLGWLWLIRH